MRTYYIYKATNLINGMSYIGQTVDFHKRVWQHLRCRASEDCVFHDAIKEYGRDNFDFKIIDTTDSEKEAIRLERYYIEKHDTYHNGYNMNKGGVGGHNSSAVVCLELDGTYVCRYDSAGDAEKIGGYNNCDVLLCCKGINHRCQDKVFMFEADYLMYGARKYVKPESKVMKAVVQFDMSGNEIARYKSAQEAAEKTGILRSRISSCTNGLNKTAGGYIFVFEAECDSLNPEEHQKNKKGRKVAQIDPNTGKVIEVFDRIADAGRKLGVNYKTIHKVVDDDCHKAFGFKWVSV